MEHSNIRIIKLNPDKYEHIYVFGDIHGMITRLNSLLAKVSYTSKDLLVFLGDYIDRGEDSIGVIDRIMALEKKTNVVALKGNHEAWAVSYLDALYSGDMQYGLDFEWLQYGGLETMKSLEKSGDTLKYTRWMHQRPHMLLLGDKTGCSHAGMNIEKSLDEQTEKDVLWQRRYHINYDDFGCEMDWYIGHTPVQVLNPGQSTPHIIASVDRVHKLTMMDTGSFLDNGHISCKEVKSGKVYQSDL